MTGILDEYPGAAAAYSLRLLNTDYTGDAVVVRRASDNATQSIGFVDGELDTDTLNTFCTGTDGFVTTWYDQSGNSYDATQTTASEQPKIYDNVNGVITENGKPAVSFDGVNDRLKGTDNGSLDNVRTGEFTYAAVARNIETTTLNYNAVLSLATAINNGGGSLAMQFHSTLKSIGFHNTWVTSTQLALIDITSILNDQLLIFQTRDNSGIIGNGSLVTNNVNNLTTSQTQSFTSNPGTNYIIGSQSPVDISSVNDWKGTIQELIIYPTDESGNKTGIETNINDFYSIY